MIKRSRFTTWIFVILMTLILGQPGGAKVYLTDFDEYKAETLMLQAVNKIRYEAGLNILILDDNLSVSCRRHAMNMAALDYFDHYDKDGLSPADRAHSAGIANPVSENIGITRTFGRDRESEVVQLLMDGFMNSESHRVNILDPNVTHIGIGLFQDVDELNKRLKSGRDPDTNYSGFGTILAVQEFYRRQVELVEPSPYKGWTSPGEFITLTLGFTDDVDEAFLRIVPQELTGESYEVPMFRKDREFEARFAIEMEGDFTIGIYASTPNADWYFSEQGQLDLKVRQDTY